MLELSVIYVLGHNYWLWHRMKDLGIFMKKSVVIIGASRGIGLGFAEAYSDDGWEVHATTRTIEKHGNLAKIRGNIKIHNLEVRNSQEIQALADDFKERGIDVLIYNAGVNEKKLEFDEVMEINAKAPFKVIGALLPAILRSSTKKVTILTSQLGAPTSIYGKSKCALNDRFREVEKDWRASGITAIVFHPGWVATDMGGRFAPVSIKESVRGMRDVIEKLSPSESGFFFTWEGRKHPW